MFSLLLQEIVERFDEFPTEKRKIKFLAMQSEPLRFVVALFLL